MPQPEIDPQTGKEIKRHIQNHLNPGGGQLTHNYGQPKPAPYVTPSNNPDSSSNNPNGKAATFQTACAVEHSNSLQCIERNYQNRSACTEFFDAYKTCRAKENEKRKEANAKAAAAGGGGSGSGWFW